MFALTHEIIDNIVFWMEDQNGAFVINVRTGDVLNIGDEDEDDVSEDDYADIPEWTPADGFGLMENFAAFP